MSKKAAISCLAVLFLSGFGVSQSAEIDAGKTSEGVFESDYFHFRYRLPKGWFALNDKVRIAENKETYQAQLQHDRDYIRRTEPGAPLPTDIFTEYWLLVASRTPMGSFAEALTPSVGIKVIKRVPGVMDVLYPAKQLSQSTLVKTLRSPEPVTVSQHDFVRADFQYKRGQLLTMFTCVSRDYVVEFDFQAASEAELKTLVRTMQSVKFSDQKQGLRRRHQ